MPVQFPQIYSFELLREIARLHNLQGEPRLLPSSGMVNEAWLVGETVVRVIREEKCDDEAERESWVVPLVSAAGVPTPELLAADLSRVIVPRPYTVYRRAKGVLLADAPGEPESYGHLYRELGRVLAGIGRISVPEERQSGLRGSSEMDAAEQLKRSVDAGAVPLAEVRAVEAIIERLDSYAAQAAPSRFAHRDLHPWNFFVDPDSGALECIIDWGDAAWGEPAMEFASMPLCALQPMLEGYREAGEPVDISLIVRALQIGVALALWELRGLDSEVFARQWWRCPVSGWEAERAEQERLLEWLA